MMQGSRLGCAAMVISIIGALNWGLVGLFHFDLIAFLFGPMTHFARVMYAFVGVSGLYALYAKFMVCKSCEHTG